MSKKKKVSNKIKYNSSKFLLTGILLIILLTFSFIFIYSTNSINMNLLTKANEPKTLKLGSFNPLESAPTLTSSPPNYTPPPNDTPPPNNTPPPNYTPPPSEPSFTPVPTCQPKKLDCWKDFNNCLVCKKLLSNCKIRETKDCPSCGGTH